MGWTLAEMVENMLHLTTWTDRNTATGGVDGMTGGLWRARMRAFLARLSVVLRARHAGGAAAEGGGGGGCDTW